MTGQKTDKVKNPSRRAALRRLAGAAVAGYVVPEVLFLSAARAESSAPSAPSGSSDTSTPSTTSTPSAPAPSGTASSASSAEEGARETCTVSGAQNADTISISRSDLRRAQEAVEAGYAKPLDQIWSTFTSEYDGKVIGVEFLDRRNNPRYRFRAISKSGRLETVTISAQTGSIQRIVGC
ncbi:MAG: hypothetical protein GQ535_07415 [Rhodobacteraceae bacterium]|nr:hypothetical protein [Paracoccaceae bacterium]